MKKNKVTFLEKLNENFNNLADKIALSDSIDGKGITYKELDILSGKVYSYLSKHNIGKEDFVMVCLPRGINIVSTCIGIWRAGAAFITVEQDYPEEKINFIYNDIKCKIKIDVDLLSKIMKENSKQGYEKCDEHTAALATYTSGTTGNPKGIVHEIGTVTNNLRSYYYDGKPIFRSDDVFAYLSPFNFIAGVIHYTNILFVGGEFAIVPYTYTKNLKKLKEFLAKKKITTAFFTPSFVRTFKDFPKEMRAFVLGSEIASDIYVDNIDVYNGYAQSETGRVVSVFKIDKPYSVTPIGKSQTDDFELKVLNDLGEKCKVGELGELCVENEFFRGYVNLPEITEKAFKNGVYHTGDIGKYLEDGNIVICGRNDDMVKVNGNRIEPAEIEKIVKEELNVNWAAAKVIQEKDRVYICAYYNEEVKFDMEEAKKNIRNRLPYYMVPSYYMYIDTIPVNANGKFSRKDLPNPNLNEILNNHTYVAPENENQKKIVSVFEQVLNISGIGIDDDFYEIGGDSISAINVVSLLPDMNISIVDMLDGRTARKIDEIVNKKATVEYTEEENEEAIKKEHYLTAMQKYMFEEQLFSPHTTKYNLPVMLKTKVSLDPKKLIEAVLKVVEAHPSLKIQLKYNHEGDIVQYYADSEMKLELEEVSEADMINIREEIMQPFDILNSPLFRCRFFKTEKNYYLYIDIHHILCDGTSMNVFFNDLSKAYNDQELKKDFTFLELEIRDNLEKTEQYSEDKKYFESLYDNKKLEKQFLRPIEDFDMDDNYIAFMESDIPICDEDYDKLMNKYGITENDLFIAIATLSQAQHNNVNDVFITWTYNGRDQAIKNNMIGNLLCDLPIAVTLNDKMTINELFSDVKKQVCDGMKHTKYPYTLITGNTAEDIQGTSFLYQHNIVNFTSHFKEKVDTVEVSNKYGVAENIFNVEIIDNGQEKTLYIQYDGAKYKKETVNQFKCLFQKIAARIVEYMNEENVTIGQIMNGKQ